MPSRRLRCSFAIAWLTIFIIVACLIDDIDAARRRRAYRLKPEDDLSSMVERNREAIGSLFAGTASRDQVVTTAQLDSLLTTASTASSRIDNKRLVHQSNNERVAKKSLLSMPGPEILQDTDNLADLESNTPHLRVKRIADLSDSSSRINPSSSKKSEPPYIDQRRAYHKVFKRFSPEEANPADENEAEYSNAFDDVDVDVPEAYLNDELSRKRNSLEDVYPEVTDTPKHEESYAEVSDQIHDTARRKRDKSRDEEEEDEETDAEAEAEGDCADDEQTGDYYYDEEEPETVNLRNEKRASEYNNEAADNQALAVDKGTDNQISESNQNSKEKDYLRFPDKAERDAAIKERAIVAPPSIQEVRQTKKKINKLNDVSEKRITKEKTKILKPKSGKKVKNSQTKMLKKVPIKNAQSDGLSEIQKDVSGCSEVNEDTMDKVKCSSNKKLVAKAVKSAKPGKELQIHEKVNNVDKDRIAMEMKPVSIGEVKDLLGKLIVKVEDLHNLVSELKVRNDQLESPNDIGSREVRDIDVA